MAGSEIVTGSMNIGTDETFDGQKQSDLPETSWEENGSIDRTFRWETSPDSHERVEMRRGGLAQMFRAKDDFRVKRDLVGIWFLGLWHLGCIGIYTVIYIFIYSYIPSVSTSTNTGLGTKSLYCYNAIQTVFYLQLPFCMHSTGIG